MLTKRAVILAKEETTYGSDSSPTADFNAILAFNPVLKPVGEKLERVPVLPTLSSEKHLIGQRHYTLTFSTELYGSGTAGSAARWGDLMKACGCAETIVAGTSVTYKPASVNLKSCSIYVYLDGLLHKVLGAVGSFSLVFVAGHPVLVNWTFSGLYVAPTDVIIISPTLDAEASSPPQVISASFSLKGVSTLVVQQLELNLGAIVNKRDDINASHGIKGFQITRREAGGSLNPESVLVATYNFWSDWISSVQAALSIAVGSGAGKVCTVTAPKVTLDDISYGDREGTRIFDIPFSLHRDAGDDEISISVT